jgi:curved DNA-binding protein CbpA
MRLSDAYALLGVSPAATDPEVRAAYRRLVQLHHPDHNAGSPEAAARFAGVQAAYVEVMEDRRSAAAGTAGARSDAELDARLAALERELREARRPAARRPAPAAPRPPTPEELGYVTTEDSLSKILDDAQESLRRRLTDLFKDE